MVGWSNEYDWTKEDVKHIIENAVDNGATTVNLDMEHASAANIRHVMEWVRELGYEPVNKAQTETVFVDLRKRGNEE